MGRRATGREQERAPRPAEASAKAGATTQYGKELTPRKRRDPRWTEMTQDGPKKPEMDRWIWGQLEGLLLWQRDEFPIRERPNASQLFS